MTACSADSAAEPASKAPSSSAPTSAPPSSSSPTSPSSPASSKSSAKATAKAPSGPSVASTEVPVNGGVILPDADYVVTQPTKGTFKAFSKICTHQGCPVSQIADREIVCRCHSSHFSIADGSVISGPASQPLPAAKTTVSGGRIVVSG